jgi:hypothetical protein
MYDYLPEYRRGESLEGYVSRCRGGRLLTTAVPSITIRGNICKDHAEQSRKLLRQPFQEKKK